MAKLIYTPTGVGKSARISLHICHADGRRIMGTANTETAMAIVMPDGRWALRYQAGSGYGVQAETGQAQDEASAYTAVMAALPAWIKKITLPQRLGTPTRIESCGPAEGGIFSTCQQGSKQ